MRIDLADWIALNMIRGIGPRTANLLLDQFGTPANVFAAPRELLAAQGLKPETITQLHDTEILDKAQAEIERLDAMQAQVITLADEIYPPLLREIYDPPIVLYVKGDLTAALSQPGIAVVGSRRCSTYGTNAANFLARELAAHGVTIISGLARGIDGAAHRGVTFHHAFACGFGVTLFSKRGEGNIVFCIEKGLPTAQQVGALFKACVERCLNGRAFENGEICLSDGARF